MFGLRHPSFIFIASWIHGSNGYPAINTPSKVLNVVVGHESLRNAIKFLLMGHEIGPRRPSAREECVCIVNDKSCRSQNDGEDSCYEFHGTPRNEKRHLQG